MKLVCDENADCEDFVSECNSLHSDTLCRFPDSLRGKGIKDPQMLPLLLSQNRSLLTCDTLIAEVNADYIPEDNPGIVVVRLRRPVKTMTLRMMRKLVEQFKRTFPKWRELELKNIQLEICEDCAMISHLPLGREKTVVKYDDNAFATAITSAIAKFNLLAPLPRQHFDT